MLCWVGWRGGREGGREGREKKQKEKQGFELEFLTAFYLSCVVL